MDKGADIDREGAPFGRGSETRSSKPTRGRGADMVLFALARTVELPRCEVLGDEHDLSHIRPEGLDLVEDGGLRPRERCTPETRDGAVGALPVATLCDLLRRQPQGLSDAGRGSSRRSKAGIRRSVGTPSPQQMWGKERLAELGHEVDLGHRLGELVAVALGEAPSNHEPRPVPASRDISKMVSINCLPGGLDERTGVDDHQIGLWLRRPGSDLPEESPLELCGSRAASFFGQPRVSSQYLG